MVCSLCETHTERYIDKDGEIHCSDCVLKDPETYIEYLSNTAKPDMVGLPLRKYGFNTEKMRNGSDFVRGMWAQNTSDLNETPKDVVLDLKRKSRIKDVIISDVKVTDTSVTYVAYYRRIPPEERGVKPKRINKESIFNKISKALSKLMWGDT